jgi:uncharacterized membrane protein YbaN (DUF454 family)
VRIELKLYALLMYINLGFLEVKIFVTIGAALYVVPGQSFIITAPTEAACHDPDTSTGI